MRSMYKSSEEQGKPVLKPDTVTYNLVLKAISNSEDDNKGEKGEALLREMQTQQETRARPNTVRTLETLPRTL
jgi:uncharacterized iron-regulated protein